MSPIIREIFAKNVQKYRVQKQLGKEELSLMLGCDNSYISKVEKCRINVTVDKIGKIAELLEVEPYQLFVE